MSVPTEVCVNWQILFHYYITFMYLYRATVQYAHSYLTNRLIINFKGLIPHSNT